MSIADMLDGLLRRRASVLSVRDALIITRAVEALRAADGARVERDRAVAVAASAVSNTERALSQVDRLTRMVKLLLRRLRGKDGLLIGYRLGRTPSERAFTDCEATETAEAEAHALLDQRLGAAPRKPLIGCPDCTWHGSYLMSHCEEHARPSAAEEKP